MKSQFVKFPTSYKHRSKNDGINNYGNGRPDPDGLPHVRPTPDLQTQSAVDQMVRNTPSAPSQASGQSSDTPARGLLSGWSPGQAQAASQLQPANSSKLAELATNKQPAIQSQPAPISPAHGPGWYQNPQQPASSWPWGASPRSQQQLSSQAPVPAQQSPAQRPPAPGAAFPPFYPAQGPAPLSSTVALAGSGNGSAGGPPRGKKKQRKKRRFPIWARVLVALVGVILLLVGGTAGYLYFTFSHSVNNIVGQQVQRAKGEEDPNASRNGADILSGPRINILLLGSDTDEKFTNPDGSHSYLAQTDIVVTIDPATKSVGMLSIPRDFYINVPGYGLHKLDEAYALGGVAAGNADYSPGGVALSRLTIEQDFGIPINYYAWIGLTGFVQVINTVGGVDVDVTHPITDDNYPDDVGNSKDPYGYMRLYIPPGPQHLDGITALEYVRSRHADLVGDFGRSARQQQVLSALKTKLNNPDIIGKLPTIANDLNGYVKTDMQLSDVFKLMNFARSINPNSINKVILDAPYSSTGTLPGGESVVFPNCAKIVPVIAKMFDLGSKAACNIQGSTGNTSIAGVSPASSPQVAPVAEVPQVSSDSLQTASQMASMSMMSLFAGGDQYDFSGIHSLLDLLLLTVFESPQALQV